MRRLVLAVAGLALAVAMLVAAPTVLAQHKPGKHRRLPDLIVTGVSIHVPSAGSTPYVQVYPDGSTAPFDVHVDVENIGNASAPRNHLRLQFLGYGLKRYPTVPALAPGAKATIVVIMHHVKLSGRLLFLPLRPTALINWNFHVPERHYTNNQTTGEDVPVIAHQWKIALWSTQDKQAWQGGTLDHTDYVIPGGTFLVFRSYDSHNKIFFYSIYADIQSSMSFSEPIGGCSGSGGGTVDHRPWPSTSDFGISYDQTRYAGYTDTSLEDPYTLTINCTTPKRTYQTSVRMNDLLTFTGGTGPVSGPGQSKSISNSGTKVTLTGSLTYKWKFDADVP